MNFMNYNLDTKLNWTETIKNLLTEISGLYIGRLGTVHSFLCLNDYIKALQLKYSFVFYLYCYIYYHWYKLLKDLMEFLLM